MQPTTLNRTTILDGVAQLTESDPDLAGVVERYGNPPLWFRSPVFATLIHIILEQQVSLASAQAAFDRLCDKIGRPTPQKFMALSTAELREIGFSRQKSAYGHALAEAILQGDLDLPALARLDDATVRRRLTGIKGIGLWTADIYLMQALRRPDVWPAGDLALAVATQQLKNLPARPKPPELATIAEAWRPWRAVAARILWHHYLSG